MLLTLKAPPGRWKGERTVRCNEAQANILRKVGWTDVPDEAPVDLPPWFEEEASSPQTIEPVPVLDPDEVRPRKKRTYHRRVVAVDADGKVNYKVKPPKRRYRRRDLTAEE